MHLLVCVGVGGVGRGGGGVCLCFCARNDLNLAVHLITSIR